MALQHRDGQRRRTPDLLIVEEPMEIRLDGALVTTTMRTPGHDFELAVGFCHSEGLLGGAAVEGIRYCGTGSAVATEFNVVSVSTGGRAPEPTARVGTTSSSCGLCGSTAIESLTERLAPIAPDIAGVEVSESAYRFGEHRFEWQMLERISLEVGERQEVFAATGASHGAAGFDLGTGRVGTVREDIGRHNAVDKLVGKLLLDGELPAHGLGLWVSGRASLEMVQKAWAAGFPLLVSVSAPSALAVQLAARANLTLVGFARGTGFTLYSGLST